MASMRKLTFLTAVIAASLSSSTAWADRPEFAPYVEWNASAGVLADVDQDAVSPDGRAGLLLDASGHAAGGTFLPKLTLGDDEIAFFGFTKFGAAVDASFDAEWEACEACDSIGEVISDVELAATLGWVDVLYGETFQRPVTFDNGYWRAETGLAGRSVGLRWPGFFNLKADPEMYDGQIVQAHLLGGQVRRRELFEVQGPSWSASDGRVEDEYTWTAYGGYILFDGPEYFFELDFVKYSYQQWTTPTPVDEGTFFPYVRRYAPGAQFAGRFELDLFDLEIDVRDGARVQLDFGLSSMTPLGLEDISVAESDMRYKWGLQVGQSLERNPIAGRVGWNAGIVSFHRLDPSGLAVDAGPRFLLEGSVRATDRLRFDTAGTLIWAKRRMVSPFAEPGDLAIGVDGRIVMARAEVEGAWEVTDWLDATAQVWGERSDRTDPLTFAQGTGVTPLRGGWGAWLGVRASFGK